MTEFNTKLIHVPDGEKFDGSVTVPIYKATTYQYPSVENQLDLIIPEVVTPLALR